MSAGVLFPQSFENVLESQVLSAPLQMPKIRFRAFRYVAVNFAAPLFSIAVLRADSAVGLVRAVKYARRVAWRGRPHSLAVVDGWRLRALESALGARCLALRADGCFQ